MCVVNEGKLGLQKRSSNQNKNSQGHHKYCKQVIGCRAKHTKAGVKSFGFGVFAPYRTGEWSSYSKSHISSVGVQRGTKHLGGNHGAHRLAIGMFGPVTEHKTF
jgi:hypothetical protein